MCSRPAQPGTCFEGPGGLRGSLPMPQAPEGPQRSLARRTWADTPEAPRGWESPCSRPHRPHPGLTWCHCVLSVPALLGPLRRICLWHDSRGPAPAWYVSHIMVKELAAGPGHSWLFPAECWLAASGRDGHTAWELGSLRRGLGFWKVGGGLLARHEAGPHPPAATL